MNTYKSIFVLLTAITLSGIAQAESFIRPIGSYYVFNDDKYSNKAGFGLAGGTTLGDQGTHELSLEWDRANWSYLYEPPAGVIGGSLVRGSGKIQPVLFNYRYRFGDNDSKVRFYAGPSIGFTQTHGDLMSSSGSVPFYFSGSYSKWSPTYSGSVGVQIKIPKNFSLDAGCSYLWIKGVDASLPYHSVIGGTGNPATFNLGDTKAMVLHLGVQVAF